MTYRDIPEGYSVGLPIYTYINIHNDTYIYQRPICSFACNDHGTVVQLTYPKHCQKGHWKSLQLIFLLGCDCSCSLKKNAIAVVH